MRTRGLVLVLVLAAVGCRGAGGSRLEAPPFAADLPIVEHRLEPIDVSRLSEMPAQATRDAPVGPYHRLTAEECHQLACSNAAAARLIELAAANRTHCILDGTPREVDDLREAMSRHMSQEARLRSAGTALDLYYQLLEAELLTDLLIQSQAEGDELVRAGEVSTAKGFKESDQFLTLRRQQVELRAERARLEAGIRRLNSELKALLGLDSLPGRLLPAEKLQIAPESIDPDQAVRVALGTRPDLDLIRTLDAGLNTRTIDAVRQALTGLVPPLGTISAATRVLAPGLHALVPVLARPDVAALHRQLARLLADRERDAAREVQTALDEWQSDRELVAIAARRVRLEADHMHDLGVKRQAGAAVETEARLARLDWLKARSDLVREAIKWKRADVKARQAMGLLCRGSGSECP